MSDERQRFTVGHTAWIVKRTELAVAAALDAELRDLAVTKAQYAVLNALARLTRASSAELARACFVTPQAMTALVAALADRGFVDRTTNPTSRRIIDVTMTAPGRQVFEQATARVLAVEDRMTTHLSHDAQAALLAALEGCIEALEAHPYRRRPTG